MSKNTSDSENDNDRYQLSNQIGYLLRLANQRHLEIFHHHMPDLTPTQFALLVSLAERTGASQNELGRQTGIDAATTNGVVDRLTKKGLIHSHTDPDDKRRLRLSLSDAGQQMVDRCIPIARIITSLTLEGLTSRESTRLLQLLKKIQPA